MKQPRKKKCKHCREWFQPDRQLQACCSIPCTIDYTQQQKREKQRKHLHTKVKENDKSHQTKLAQRAFNRFIRLRDSGLPCVSCGRTHEGQLHAGHYRSVGAAPGLRFTEDNCHLQCSVCNNHKSGNVIEYRINLVKKIGIERVEWLEQDHPPKKWTLDEIKAIKKHYLAECRRLEKEAA